MRSLLELRQVVSGIVHGLNRGLAPFVSHFGRNIGGDDQSLGIGQSATDGGAEPLGSVRPVEDFERELVGEHENSVQYRQPKLTLNQVLELGGHPSIFVRHPIPSSLVERIDAIQARRNAGDESGRAA